MILHIIRKDWKLLWGLVLILSAAQLCLIALEFSLSHFGESVVDWLELPLLLTVMIGICFLIAVLVHQDAVSGGHQDWLVRPIKRRDLLLAKLFFIILTIHFPMFVLHIFQSSLLGFPLFQSISLAFSKTTYLLIVLTIPVAAFSSFSKNLTELIMQFMSTVACLAAFALISVALTGGGRSPTGLSGIAWVASTTQIILVILLSTLVLKVQYLQNKKLTFLIVPPVIACIFFIPQILSWNSVFAIQETFSQASDEASSITVEFSPGMGRLESEPNKNFGQVNMAILEARSRLRGSQQEVTQYIERFAQSAITISIPLAISELPAGMLLANRSYYRLMDRSLEKTYFEGEGETIEVVQQSPGSAAIYQELRIPHEIFNQTKSKQLRLEIDYSFTLFENTSTFQMAAISDEQRTSNIGWCRTRANKEATAIQLGCKQVGQPPMCVSIILQQYTTGLQNPEMTICYPNYIPYPQHHIYEPTTVSHFGVSLPFYDPQGFVLYPVGGQQLAESKVIIKEYRPKAHFTKQLIIENIQIESWTSQWELDK